MVDVDDLAAAPNRELHHVRRADSARERLVAQHERIRGTYPCIGDEEPLTLTHVRGVASPKWILRPLALDLGPDNVRLQRRLRRCGAGDAACLLRNRRDEPVPLVVTAEELALPAPHPREQQEVPIARLHVNDLQLDGDVLFREADVEVLTARIPKDVDSRETSPGALRDVEARAHSSEATFEKFARHGVSSLAAGVTREGWAGRSRASVHLPSGSSTQQRDRSAALLSSLSRTTTSERCFPSHSPTLRPWIADRACARARRSPSYVEEFWSPFPGCPSVKERAKANALFCALFPTAPRIFLSQAGPRFRSIACSS
jgi:hypothetical protein